MTTPLAFSALGPTTDHSTVQPGISFSDHRMTHNFRLKTQGQPAKGWILVVFLMSGLFSACSSDPFIDGRREAGATRDIGPSTVNRVAICYNSRSTTAEAVLRLAESECAITERVPRYDGEDIFACSVVNPTRAYFRCVAPKT